MRPIESARAADEAHARFTHMEGDHLTLLNVYQARGHIHQSRSSLTRDPFTHTQAYREAGCDTKWCWDNFVSFRALQVSSRAYVYCACRGFALLTYFVAVGG